MAKKLYTIGHSTHSLEEFIGLLQAHNIKQLVDVRSIPRSRHVPWFNEDKLKAALAKEKIAYTHLAELGGLRHSHKDSVNMGWRNASFRGYADYMQTAEFFIGLKKINSLIKSKKHVAIMCAEAVPWRCHRSLIADAEIVRSYQVFEIRNKRSLQPLQLTSFAKVNRETRPIKIIYPAAVEE